MTNYELLQADLAKETSAHAERVQSLLEQFRQSQVPPVRLVRAGEDLHAALREGGRIELEQGATFEGAFRFTVPGTDLKGNNAFLRGVGAPAIFVPPGTSGISISDVQPSSNVDTPVLLGENVIERQRTLEQVPRDILLTNVAVQAHRGKRAFEVNAVATLTNCRASDCWAEGIETKGVNILNTPGPVQILGGSFEVGSIGILTGGDTMKVAGAVPQVLIRGVSVTRPLSWRTDGFKRMVKTSIEFKAGLNCRVEDCTIEGCWKDGQDGYGATVTPRNAQSTVGVYFRNVRMRNIAGGYNVTGHDTASVTPEKTSRLVIQGGSVVTNKAGLGNAGRGTFLQLTAGPFGSIGIDDVVIIPEHSVVYHAERTAIDLFGMGNCYAVLGTYGMDFGNVGHAGDLSLIAALAVTGNTFSGGTAAERAALPSNTYVTRAAFDALPAVQERLA